VCGCVPRDLRLYVLRWGRLCGVAWSWLLWVWVGGWTWSTLDAAHVFCSLCGPSVLCLHHIHAKKMTALKLTVFFTPMLLAVVFILLAPHVRRAIFQRGGDSATAEPEPGPEPGPEPEPGLESNGMADGFNDAISGYLSAIGVVFALSVQQHYDLCSARRTRLREYVTTECSLIHRVLLHVRQLEKKVGESSQDDLALLTSIRDALAAYTDRLWQEIDVALRPSLCGLCRSRGLEVVEEHSRVTSDFSSIDNMLAVTATLHESRGAEARVGQLLQTTESDIHALLLARYARNSGGLKPHITAAVWLHLTVLAICLFFGVMLLETGSVGLNLLICSCVVATISFSFLSLANLDDVCDYACSCLRGMIYHTPELTTRCKCALCPAPGRAQAKGQGPRAASPTATPAKGGEGARKELRYYESTTRSTGLGGASGLMEGSTTTLEVGSGKVHSGSV
jgi:hypothetical protein